MQFLHVSIVWGGTPKTLDQLRPIFDLADEWLCYGGSNWIVYTSETTFTWQGRMRAVTGDSDVFFISQIQNVTECGGWLPQWMWAWIKKPRGTSQPFGYFPPSS